MILGTNRKIEGGYFYAPLYLPYDLKSLIFFIERVIPGSGKFRVIFRRDRDEINIIMNKIFKNQIVNIFSYEELKKTIYSGVRSKTFLIKFYEMVDLLEKESLGSIQDFTINNTVIDDEFETEIGRGQYLFAVEKLNLKIDALIAKIGNLKFIAVKRHLISSLYPMEASYIPELRDVESAIEIIKKVLERIYV